MTGTSDRLCRRYGKGMSAADVDDYLETIGEPGRSTLEEMRRRVLSVIPQAEQVISYGLPAFRVSGKAVVGLGAFTSHLSWLPHSGSVLPALGDELAGYTGTKGSLHFPLDQPLPMELIERLLAVRMAQAGVA